MIRNYIVTALRNFRNNKFFTLINISGLSIGIACSLLILLWVSDELSYDKFHPKADNCTRFGSIQILIITFILAILTFTHLYALKTRDSNIKNTAITDRRRRAPAYRGRKEIIHEWL